MLGTIVYVTQDDIDNGEPADAGSCPVALAIERTFPNVFDITVHSVVILVDNVMYNVVDSKLTQWIEDFDEGEPVEPFSFRVGREIVRSQ